MRRIFPIACVIALAVVACKKKPGPSAGAGQPPATPETTGQAAPARPPAAPAAAPPPRVVTANAQNQVQQNVSGDVSAFLTQQLGIFVREKGRLPQSFAELAAARLDSMPRPPQGKKWVIDAADQQVKAVGQ
jgi:hypothetical protein